MPIDPNIALGVRPIEQPNMLGQMAQAMAIRQANQEYEDTNALRSIAAKHGGDISSPEFIKDVGMQNPKYAADLRAKALANDKTTGEIVKSRLETSRELLSNVRTPEEYLAWHQGNHKDPLIGPLLASKGITADTSMATIQESLKRPGGFEELLKKSAMGLEKFYQDQTSRRNADTTSGPGYLQAGIAREKLTQEQAELARVRGILTGGAPPPAAFPAAGNAPMGGGGQLGSGTFGIPTGVTPTPSTGAVARPNVLATQVAPPTTFAPNVNGLNPNAPSRVDDIKQQITQLARVGGPVANQALEGLIKEYNVLNPAGKIEIDSTGTLRTIDERSGTSKVITGADGKPVKGNVAPIIKSVLDQTDPAGKRMIDVNVNEYVQGTGLGADGKGAAPKGVIGISNSQIPPNYMPDPNNPQGVIPVPGSPADPKAAALLRGPRAGYKFNAEGDEVRIPQTGVPEGLRLKPDERWNETKQVVEQVPGSAAFIEQQKKHAKDLNAVKTTQTTTKWGIDRINTILDPKNKSGFEGNFGGFNAYVTERMSGNTATVKSELDSLKSELKEKGLQLFRTGGSIGAITEKEWPILEGMIASLNPKLDEDAARNILEKIRLKFKELETLASENYDDQWKGTQYHKPSGANRPASGSGVDTSNKFLQ